jgi:signal transduction histidine kinase
MDDLLTISEMESGRIKLNLGAVQLQPLVEKVLTDFRARAESKKFRLKNNAPEVSVRADPDRLEQVLANLVDNAIKYGRNEGSVAIGARVMAGSQVEVFVRDDGPGIPAEALPRIFERFYRVDKARSRQEGGTGLGLSIVKHIIQIHGGRTWATSEPGKGATFFFTMTQA